MILCLFFLTPGDFKPLQYEIFGSDTNITVTEDTKGRSNMETFTLLWAGVATKPIAFNANESEVRGVGTIPARLHLQMQNCLGFRRHPFNSPYRRLSSLIQFLQALNSTEPREVGTLYHRLRDEAAAVPMGTAEKVREENRSICR